MRPSFLINILLNLIISFELVHLTSTVMTRHFKWEVGYLLLSPDCAEKDSLVIAVNGKFPGPTIRANAGDTIVVNLTNKLPTEGVTIHWHGIRQNGTPWADGTASISQCAVSPDKNFVYRFKVDRAGTFMYHGHYGMQRAAGLYGSLIVDLPSSTAAGVVVVEAVEPFIYDGELNLLLSDWYHASVNTMMAGLSAKPFRWVGEPQSLLLNGRGQFNCALAGGRRRRCKCKSEVFTVEPNKTYRLRIASVTSLASLNLAIQNHKMTVVEADGNYVEPFITDDIDIYSGQSYSVLITTDQPISNYWLSVGVRGRLPQTPPVLGIFNYKPEPPIKLPASPPPPTPAWNNFSHSRISAERFISRAESPPPPSHSHLQIQMLNTQNLIDGYIKWSINNVSMVLPTSPYLQSLGADSFAKNSRVSTMTSSFPRNYDIMKPPANPNSTYGNNLHSIDYNTTVDVILQNANALEANESEIHPWHLHGHDAWVLGYGEGRFSGDTTAFNIERPPLRNTVVVFPYGWTAIRFVADNPGVWAFHCHIEPHLFLGMGMVFAEAVEMLPELPDEALQC